MDQKHKTRNARRHTLQKADSLRMRMVLQEGERLRRAKNQPELERTVFILRYFEGYNAAEVGELLDLNSSTVRSRLASARRKLKQIYETG